MTHVSGDVPACCRVPRRGCRGPGYARLISARITSSAARSAIGHRVVAHDVALVLDVDDLAEVRQDRLAGGERHAVREFEVAFGVARIHRAGRPSDGAIIARTATPRPRTREFRARVRRQHGLPRAAVVALRKPRRRVASIVSASGRMRKPARCALRQSNSMKPASSANVDGIHSGKPGPRLDLVLEQHRLVDPRGLRRAAPPAAPARRPAIAHRPVPGRTASR